MSGPYGKFMNKKDFHPGTFFNIRRVWEAEDRHRQETEREKLLIKEREQEQALHEAKGFAMMNAAQSNTEKQRLQVNFMYSAPPGYVDPRLKLQRVTHPAADQEDADGQDSSKPKKPVFNPLERPFGKSVRNVTCIRCRGLGHRHVDRECPLYNQPSSDPDGNVVRPSFEDPAVLMRRMHAEGYTLSRNARGRKFNPASELEQLIPDDPEDEELRFLASLPESEKLKLLQQLEEAERRHQAKKAERKRSKQKHKRKRKKAATPDEPGNDSSNHGSANAHDAHSHMTDYVSLPPDHKSRTQEHDRRSAAKQGHEVEALQHTSSTQPTRQQVNHRIHTRSRSRSPLSRRRRASVSPSSRRSSDRHRRSRRDRPYHRNRGDESRSISPTRQRRR